MSFEFILLILALIGGGVATYFLIMRNRPRHMKTDYLYTEALDALLKGNKRVAINRLRDVVKQDSNHINAYLQLGNILRETAPQQAIKIHQSLTVRPNLPESLQLEIHKSLALDYKTVNDYPRAKEEAEIILKMQRRNLWATNFLVQLEEEKGNWAAAAQYARLSQKIQNISNKEQLAKYQLNEGLELLSAGKINQALTAFQKASKLAPDYSLPYRYIGDIYEQNRNLTKAIEHWEKYALRTTNNGVDVFSKIESALFDLGRFSEIEQFYRRILKHDANNLEALSKLANVLVEKGDLDSALALIENALNKKPDSLHARLMKLKLNLSRKTPAELAVYIDEIIELIPADDVSTTPVQDD
ncbi:MAG: tetratricopeptide repeat protein [Fidelibacterota bacterium]